MKKYIKPSIEVIALNTEGMIAASLGSAESYNNEVGNRIQLSNRNDGGAWDSSLWSEMED